MALTDSEARTRRRARTVKPVPPRGESGDADRPLVSIVVPMLDELGHIDACLDGFAAQSYPLELLEVLVVDGGSTDGSRRLVEGRAAEETFIRIVDNPLRRASAAFNAGVAAARGDVIGLFSAHGVPDPDFVARSVLALEATGAHGVGGRYVHEGTDPVGNAIGLAMVSPVGMASPHRFAQSQRDVDTISHPLYLREALADVGPFDETLLRNSDYELNWRMRDLGMRLVFDPSISSIYRPRPSLAALARQFWWYGRWKQRVIRRHPRSIRVRHLVPPVAVVATATLPLLLLRPSTRRFAAGWIAAYATVIGTGVVVAEPRRNKADPMVLAAAFPVMHTAWGAGFIASAVEDAISPIRSRSWRSRRTP